MTLHQPILTSAPTTDQSDVFRLRALFCEREARQSTDWTSKQDWEVLALECHMMAYLAARTNGEISQIDVARHVDLAQPPTCTPRRPAAAPGARSGAVARQDHQRGSVARWFGVAGAEVASNIAATGGATCAFKNRPVGRLLFVSPSAQKENPTLSAFGTCLCLEVGQISAALIDPPSGCHLRNEPDCQE
jgi:hypothetical protein